MKTLISLLVSYRALETLQYSSKSEALWLILTCRDSLSYLNLKMHSPAIFTEKVTTSKTAEHVTTLWCHTHRARLMPQMPWGNWFWRMWWFYFWHHQKFAWISTVFNNNILYCPFMSMQKDFCQWWCYLQARKSANDDFDISWYLSEEISENSL